MDWFEFKTDVYIRCLFYQRYIDEICFLKLCIHILIMVSGVNVPGYTCRVKFS